MGKTPEKSCVGCLFNVTSPVIQSDAIGQPIDSGYCLAGRGPTSLPFATREERAATGEMKAKGCSSYVNASESKKDVRDLPWPTTTPIVAMPDPKAVELSESREKPKLAGALKNCMSCPFYVKPDRAVEAGLWNVGICGARGIMIPNNMRANIARDCEHFDVGNRDPETITRMVFLPEYDTTARVASAVESIEREYVDPQDYPTDAEVSEKDAAMGIKAWRKIDNPEGEMSILLPVFDSNFFSESERAKIPQTGDDEHPERYIDFQGLVYRVAVLWMHLNETPALWGVAGTGKTEFYRHMAWLMGLPFHRISVTASSEVEDLAGKMHFSKEKGTYFEYGRLPRAWMSPGVVCLDEPNVGPSDVWQFIRPLTDNSKQLVLDVNNGERVDRHPMAFLGMAMNPDWDVRNSGAEKLADADGSRLMHIFVELPDESIEREIIAERCRLDGFAISHEQINTIIKIGKDLRKLADNETLPITWGIRQQIKVARALKWFTYAQAYKLAAADYLEPEHQDIIRDSVRANSPAPKAKSAGAKFAKSVNDDDSALVVGAPPKPRIILSSTYPSAASSMGSTVSFPSSTAASMYPSAGS